MVAPQQPASFRPVDILKARELYQQGRNVSEFLRTTYGASIDASTLIEIVYDVQAGSYAEAVTRDPTYLKAYTAESGPILSQWLEPEDTLLDAGTGEMTTLSMLAGHLLPLPRRILAFDISWSRLFKGLDYARNIMGEPGFSRLSPFVADMTHIPLSDKAVAVTTTNHALEPNGTRLDSLLAELFRVTRKMLVLLEPCYELASPEARARMDRLGYIRDMEGAVARLGGTLVERIPMRTVVNPLNPTAAYVIKPPDHPDFALTDDEAAFTVPGTGYRLTPHEGFLHSHQTGLCFPVLKGIPVLKPGTAILASALPPD